MKAKVEDRQPASRKAPKSKGSELADPKRRVAEAEQLAAISEILHVMSGSPGDVQPVLDAVAERAARLCESPYARIMLVDGGVLRAAAEYSLDGTSQGITVPLPLRRTSMSGRAVHDRTTIHHDDVAPLLESEYPDAVNSRRLGIRAVLAMPLMREGEAYGSIIVYRREPRAFSPDQIALVETFARQAAIAIENARLFKETKEALEQQTATSEILRVIASSPGNVRPMLKAVAERALKLCEAADATIFLAEGDQLRAVARFGSATTPVQEGQAMPLNRGWVTGRAVVDRMAIHVEDLGTEPEEEFPIGRQLQRRLGHHTALSVPLMRENRAIGAIALWRMEARRFTDKQVALVNTFADQAAIAIENVRLFNETKEALERQTATSEILRVISQSPTNVQPVFDAIAAAALRLCEASSTAVLTFDGKLMWLAALANVSPEEAAAVRLRYPKPAGRETAGSRAILTGSTIIVPDVLEDPEFESRARSFRSVVSVPLIREGSPIGAITVGRPEPGRFPDAQIALLQTFADQAVIAIENVRLFTELTQKNRALTQAHAQVSEALERQTATSEVLRVISSSPSDVQPVFETIVASAARLCSAESAAVYRFDGEIVDFVVGYHFSPEALEAYHRRFPRPLRETDHLQRVLDGSVLNISDIEKDPHTTSGSGAVHRARGVHSTVIVPMLREDRVIGAIGVSHRDVGAFTNERVELLKTFADQAVIAIENVRLFNETKEALEQQTATSEILRVISQSPTDVQPVLDAVAERALKLCDAAQSVISLVEGTNIRFTAGFGSTRTYVGEVMPLSRGLVAGRAIIDRTTIHLDDLAAVSEDEYPIGLQMQRSIGHHTLLAVPLMREDRAIGVITVWRMEVRPFTEKQISLVKTFADQAAIAIENVRLFTELESRTAELTRSVGELKALGEVGQAVSSTLDLETVLSTIVSRATQLAGMDGGSIWEYDETREEFYLHATDRLPDELVEVLRATPIRKGEGALGRLAITGEPVEIHDIAVEPGYPTRLREIRIRSGHRSVVAVPLLREDHLLGALAVSRTTPGEFAPEVIALLKTFATQSALAIQNARLFREIEVKSRELEAASRHKSEFLANMSHELRTPLNAIIGFSEVLSERMFGELNEKQAEYIGDILASGQHLLSLINDILDLSKIEAGRMELELSDFDLPSTIENTLILVRERAVRRGITLGRTVDERLGTIRADERKVKQVLLNLLSNALKFTPEGGRIDVRATVNDGVAEISVRDTGVGIAPEEQEAVFEEFRQVGTAAKKVEGTGLGLAISRKFIELHGGKIWVTSQVGTGSIFAFTLPLQRLIV